MTEILTLATSVLPFLAVTAFPIILVRLLDSPDVAESPRPDLGSLPLRERPRPAPVLTGRQLPAEA